MIRLRIGNCPQDTDRRRRCETTYADFHPLTRQIHFTREFWRDPRAPLAIAHELAHAVLQHKNPGESRAILRIEAEAWRQVVRWRRRAGIPLTQQEKAEIKQAYGSYQVAAGLW